MSGGKKKKFILDTVILIDHLNEVSQATSWLREHLLNSAISVITRAEVLAGTGVGDRATVTEFLDAFPCLEMDVEVADATGDVRQHHRLKLPDAIQLAFSRVHGMQLVTRNTKDFPAKTFPDVLIPYRLKE
jgi:hypothetical protein